MISLAAAEKVANAVLCEGQVLYPYRASAVKNQLRWQFGVLAPRDFCAAGGGDRWCMRTTCLLDGAAEDTALVVRARFASMRARTLEVAGSPVMSVEVTDTGGSNRLLTSFDETVERHLSAGPLTLGEVTGRERLAFFSVPATETRQVVDSEAGVTVAYYERAIDARMVVRADPVPGPWGLAKVSVTVENTTPAPQVGPHCPPAPESRAEALRRSLVSTHLLLGVGTGRWLSAADPPEFASGLVGMGDQEGCFPVLVGDDRVVLAAPIILYDHPQVAPESPGDFCDATEIDEILALRTLTLTDEERREARATDGRAAAIVDRCQDLPPEVWERLHGAIRSVAATGGSGDRGGPPGGPGSATGGAGHLEPGDSTVRIGGMTVRTGTRVRLRPGPRGDAQDLFFAGAAATVAGVFDDLDGGVHLAVVVDGDPGADMHEWYGRYRYFRPDEIEVLS